MAGKKPTAGQPYRAGYTTPTPWAEARERLADTDTYWLAGAKQLPFAPVRSHPRIAADTKRPKRRVSHAPALCGAGRKRTTTALVWLASGPAACVA